MKRIVAFAVIFAVLLLFAVPVNADNATLLVTGNADWVVADNCAAVLSNSRMQRSEIFKDYGSFGQQHIMTNSANGKECSAVYRTNPAAIIDALKNGTHIEFLCFVAEECACDTVKLAFGDFTATRTIVKNKINRLSVSMTEITHGSSSLADAKTYLDSNYISIGMTAVSGRIDLVFSDIYVSNGSFFSGPENYTDLNSQRPDGQIVNFGKRVDFEFFQAGNTVTSASNGSTFAPLSSATVELSGEADWTSNITFIKYLSIDALKGCDGLMFYFTASGSGFQPLITVTLKSLSGGKRYSFTHTSALKSDSLLRITVDFPSMISNPYGNSLAGDILSGVYAIEINFAQNVKSTAFSGRFELSDIYTRVNGKSALPAVTTKITKAETGQAHTEMPTMAEENSAVMRVAELYSLLNGVNPDNYGYTDYMNLHEFLTAYEALSEVQKYLLEKKYGITPDIYKNLKQMYENMPVPQSEKENEQYSQYLADETDTLKGENGVTIKTFLFLIIAAGAFVLLTNQIIKEKQPNND